MRLLMLAVWLLSAHAFAEDREVDVVVVAVDVSAGTTITAQMLSTRHLPQRFVTSSMVRAATMREVVNQVARFPISAGEFLRWNHLETPWNRAQACRKKTLDGPASDAIARARAAVKRR